MMVRFVSIRMARGIVTLLLMVTFAFVVLRVSGDPVRSMLSPETPAEAIAAFRKSWGLDQPIWIQYIRYLQAILHGDLGQSVRDGRAAVVVVAERIPVTLQLTVPALMLNIAIGIPAGLMAALRKNSLTDRILMTSAIAGFTIPPFVLGLVLVLLFSVELSWLPSGGSGTLAQMILPVITLGIGGAAVLARFTRNAMLGVLGEAYVRTGSAKGVPWRRVVIKHAFPNAAIPILTIIGFMIGNLIAGTVLVESVFSWPGLGSLLVASVLSRDLAVVQCILLFVAGAMVLSNVLVDLLYGLLDPRLRSGADK